VREGENSKENPNGGERGGESKKMLVAEVSKGGHERTQPKDAG